MGYSCAVHNFGGIYSGAFTPTEAAAVAVFYALLIGGVVYRELTLKRILVCLKVTAMISGAVLIIVGPAKAFGELMSLLSVPDLIGDALGRCNRKSIFVAHDHLCNFDHHWNVS